MPRRDTIPEVYDVTIVVHPVGYPERKKTTQLPSIHRDNIRRAAHINESSILHTAIGSLVDQIEAEIRLDGKDS